MDPWQKQPKERQNLRKNARKRKKVHFLQNKTSPFCYYMTTREAWEKKAAQASAQAFAWSGETVAPNG